MKTEIGDMPDSFFDTIKKTGSGSKILIIPHKTCEMGDYEEGDEVRVWIKKVKRS